MLKKTPRGDLMLEGVKIIFRNFGGRPGKFKPAGDRGFSVLLDKDLAEALKDDGFNVKTLKPREEGDEPAFHLPVKVKYNGNRYDPTVVLVTDRGRTTLTEDMVDIVDISDITNVDLVINAYNYEVNGSTGISAYLQRAYITIEEDEFERKYSNVPDSAKPTMEYLEEFMDD